jgi:hypothetical protein
LEGEERKGKRRQELTQRAWRIKEGEEKIENDNALARPGQTQAQRAGRRVNKGGAKN